MYSPSTSQDRLLHISSAVDPAFAWSYGGQARVSTLLTFNPLRGPREEGHSCPSATQARNPSFLSRPFATFIASAA